MTYDEAMAKIHRTTRVTVGRTSAPKMRIGWRFGRPMMLAGVPSQIDYTPTEGDMRADDWAVIEDGRR